MTRMLWDVASERTYTYGIDRGVVYSPTAEAWNGLISIDEGTDTEDVAKQHVDGLLVTTQVSLGSFIATVQAYSTPDIILDVAGHADNLYTSQVRKPFNMTYRTFTGNQEDPDFSYQVHLVYNAFIKPSKKQYDTLSDNPDAIAISWDLVAKPSKMDQYFASAHFIIDSSVVHSWTLADLEDILYGTQDTPPRMPSVDELLELFETGVILRIIDHGDGTWTADGPASAIQMLDDTTFSITWPSAIYIKEDTYKISSL